MATNYHSELPNSQLHNPKDFVSAHTDSVCIKDSQSSLKWLSRGYDQNINITTIADVTGLLGGKYFLFKTRTHSYQVWFDVDNSDSVVIGPGYTSVEVDISANDPANTVASRLRNALNSLSDVTATVSTNVVSMTISSSEKAYPPLTPYDISTGFKFVYTETAVTNQYLTTDSSGNIEWIAKPTIPTIPSQHHYISAAIAPKSSSHVNVYMTPASNGYGSHSGVNLGASAGGTLPTTVLKRSVPIQSFFILPSNVEAFKIHYSVWHTDAGTQSVDWRFFDARLDTGTGSVTLNNIASITDSVPAGEQVHGIETCSSAGSGARGLILYGKVPTQRNYFISATISLTVT